MKKTSNSKQKKAIAQSEQKKSPEGSKSKSSKPKSKRHRKNEKSKKATSKSRRSSTKIEASVKKNKKRSSPQKSAGKSTKKKNLVKKNRRKKRKRLGLEIALTLAITLLILSTVVYFTIRIPTMEGYAMTKVLNDKDRLVVNKLGEVKRFKMVYFKIPHTKEVSIRRVIGMPGEEVHYKNDELYINNKLVPERFLEQAISEARQSGLLVTQDFTLKQITDVIQVPKNKYFVLGDNRQFANDSRNYGFVDAKDIIGVVELRYFPFHTATGF